MKRKILIALLVVLALSVSVLAGCNLDIMSIELKSGTLATEYYVGETVDLNKAKLTVTKSDGTTEDVALTSSMLDKAISTAQAGETTYTVTYEGKTCEITIKVKAPTIAVKTGTLTTEYYVGDEVSFTGAKLTVTEGDKTRDVDLTAAMVSPAITTAAANTTTHTISYNGATTTVNVTVTAPTIALKQGTLKLEYLVGDAVSLDNAQITVTCGNRPVTNVALTAAMLDKAISTAAVGSTEYTISYNGATAKFTVIVRQVKSIVSVEGLTLDPIKGENVEFTNAKLNVTYSDDTTGQVALTAAMLDKAISTAEVGKTTYTITYGGKTLDIEIEVKDVAVKSIAIAQDLEREYYLGYTYLDRSAQKLIVTFVDDTTRSIALSSATFSPAFEENATVGNKEYTLTFGDKTTTLNFTVCDIELQLVNGFKKTYNVGDEIYVNGKLANSQIKVVAVNAARTVLEDAIDVTQEMVKTVFNTDTQGEKSLTIEYKNKTIEVGDIVVNPITIAVVTTGENAFVTKLVKGSTASYAGKLQITYTDNTTKLIDINSNMFVVAISTSELGEKAYTVRYKDAETTVTIKVVPAEADKVAFVTWTLPEFIRDYTTKSSNINDDPLNGESTDFRMTAKYEVGNANKFLLAPVAASSNGSVQGTIWTNAKFEVKDDSNNYTILTGDALKEFVTIENNAYLFSNTAAGKTVKITITPDEDYHTVSASIAPLTFEFVVVENGYNVYDQRGLAVMTDLIRPEIWADILGCAVDANGAYVYTDNTSDALCLPADAEPLFKYIGNVDWIILHGDITIDPDNLPDAYFWTDRAAGDQDYKDLYDAALNTLNGAAYETARAGMFLGSLRDWAYPTSDGYGNYTICKSRTWVNNDGSTSSSPVDDNNNKGLYCSTKINVSGNFNSIKLLQGRSEGGRILESVVYHHTHEAKRRDEVGPQWHVFKMFEDSANYGDPIKEFTIKNISLKGTTSLAGTTAVDSEGKGRGQVSGGLAMVNFASKKAHAINVLAEGFNVNFSGDNYFAGQIMDLELNSCRIVDSFSAAIFGWRVRSNVVKSYLADFGGPAFIINDGDRRGGGGENAPSVTLDKDSFAEAYAAGTEPWYAALDSKVTFMFGLLQLVDRQLQENAGLTFFHNNGTGNRANVVAIIIPETGSVFEDQTSKEPNDRIVISGSYTHVKDGFTVKASMDDDKAIAIQGQAASTDAGGTVIISSGLAYAFVANQTVGAYDPSQPLPPVVVGGQVAGQVTGVTLDPGTALGGSWDAWKLAHNDTLTVWLQADTGKSPYIGVVIGDLTEIATQG